MTDAGDLARDLRLAESLGRLPAAALPAGLAERLVRNATSVPQYIGAFPAQPTIPVRAGSRRGLVYAAGAAIAASLGAALLLQGGGSPVRPDAAVQVAQNTPAPLRAPVVIVRPSELVMPRSQATDGRPPVAHKKAASSPADSKPAPDRAPAEIVLPQDETPALVVQQPAPKAQQPEQALVGPPDTDDLGTPLPQSGPAPGFGISGSGASPPVVTGPVVPAMPRGGHAGGMPRF